MFKFRKFITAILCFATLCTSCAVAPAPVDGDVVHLFSGTANYIVQQAANFKPGTQLFTSDTLYVFARGFQNGFGFVVMDKITLAARDPNSIGGNLVSLTTYEAFRQFLTSRGFQIAKTLPAALSHLASDATSTFTTFFILPVGALGEGGYFEDVFLAPYEGVDQ